MAKRLAMKVLGDAAILDAGRDVAELRLGELAAEQIERDAITVEMEAEIKGVRDRYAGRLTDLDAMIEARMRWLTDWAVAHPGEFPKDRKSLDMTHGTIGFRTCTPKLGTLRGWTWKKVLDKMLSIKEWRPFIRVIDEIDRESLIASRDAIGKAKLAEIGVEVRHDEAFFVEIKRESAEMQSTRTESVGG
jgi:phage host-nuclease inhibitor protein Gam